MEYERKSTVNHLKMHRDPTSKDQAPIETKWTNQSSRRIFIQTGGDPSSPVWIDAGELLLGAFKNLLNDEGWIYRIRDSYERNKKHSEFEQAMNIIVQTPEPSKEPENVPLL